jgi:tryptophanyl-tRNA synthetase
MEDPGHIESLLQRGAERAREHSAPLMQKVRQAVGISAIA